MRIPFTQLKFSQVTAGLLIRGFLLWGIGASLAAEKLKPIFDGKTLDGWVARGGAVFEVEDGVIVGKSDKGSHGWLCSKQNYGDFILELEVKLESGNSGVQIRSHIN